MRGTYKRKVFGGRLFCRVLSDGKLLGTGNNDSGQLGSGDTTMRSEFSEILIPKEAGKIVLFRGRWSSRTTIVLTENGLYGTGCAWGGVFGDGTTENRLKMSEISFYRGKCVVNYFDSEGLWVFLKNFEVWRSGLNHQGQMGNGSSNHIKVPEKLDQQFLLEKGERIVHLCSSSLHVLLLTNKKSVYCSGANNYAQLGLVGKSNRRRFENLRLAKDEISSAEKIVQVSCGEYHTLLLTQIPQVFSCGYNDYGSAAHNRSHKRESGKKEIIAIPTAIPTFKKGKKQVFQICAGEMHSVFLTVDQEIYTCGLNANHQCGVMNSPTGVCIFVPTLVKTDQVRPISCCTMAYTSIFVTLDGIYIVGDNSEGQAGLEHFNCVKKLTKMKLKIKIERNDRATFLGVILFRKFLEGAKQKTDLVSLMNIVVFVKG